MKAIRIHEFGVPDVLKFEDCPARLSGRAKRS